MKKLIVFISLFIIGILVVNAQLKVSAKTGSSITQQEAQEALDFNNKIRADVACPPLEWSVELAAYAQEWAEHLINEGGKSIYHRVNEDQDGKNYGENIYWATTSIEGSYYTAIDAVKSWYDEIEYYDYRKNDTTNPKKVIGHYTQLVWKSTKQMGIGVARNDWITIVVANYDPPGNWVGEKPY